MTKKVGRYLWYRGPVFIRKTVKRYKVRIAPIKTWLPAEENSLAG